MLFLFIPLGLLTIATFAIGSGTNDLAHFCALLFFPLVAAVYLWPTAVALHRRSLQTERIFLLNLLLGWTFVGWVGALAWAAQPRRRT